jgi:hypothetical protein
LFYDEWFAGTIARFSRSKGTGKSEKHLIEFDDGERGWYDLRAESKRGHLRCHLWGSQPHLHHHHRGAHGEDGRGGCRFWRSGVLEGGRGETGDVRAGNMRADVVGARVSVYWDGDGEWFAGTI